jgi:hypothetical protein
VRRAIEKHLTLREVTNFWDILSPGTFVHRLASRGTKTTLISARNDAVFIPELTARLRLLYQRAAVPLVHVMIPCGHYSIGCFPFSLAASSAVVNHIEEWTGVRPAGRSLHALQWATRSMVEIRHQSV